MKNKLIYAITPARGNSKGIKNKNLKYIKNKSLLQICFDSVKNIKIVKEIVISSDSNKIIQRAASIGYKVYFKRPKNLSGDKIGDMPVIKHALLKIEKIKNIKIDYIIMLQVTSPLRKSSYIKKCIREILKKKLDAVWTISKVDNKYHPNKQLIIDKKKLQFFSNKAKRIVARQQLNTTYFRNGAAYIFSRKAVLKENILPRKSGYIVIKDKLISIDTKNDLNGVEEIISFK